MPTCACTTSVCCLLTLCGSYALKWTLPPMVLATLIMNHRACTYFILYFLVFFATLSHQVNFTSGGLTKIQEALVDPGSVLQDYVTTINNCCTDEIVL